MGSSFVSYSVRLLDFERLEEALLRCIVQQLPSRLIDGLFQVPRSLLRNRQPVLRCLRADLRVAAFTSGEGEGNLSVGG